MSWRTKAPAGLFGTCYLIAPSARSGHAFRFSMRFWPIKAKLAIAWIRAGSDLKEPSSSYTTPAGRWGAGQGRFWSICKK